MLTAEVVRREWNAVTLTVRTLLSETPSAPFVEPLMEMAKAIRKNRRFMRIKV